MAHTRLEPHDKNQLELKLAYVLDPERRKQRYRVETYLFLPVTLGLNSTTYTAERFFEQTLAFVRLKTPTVSLASLTRKKDVQEFFAPTKRLLRDMLAGKVKDEPQAQIQLKLIGCVFRSAVRDELRHVLKRFDRIVPNGETDAAGRAQVADLFGRFGDDLASALGRIRVLGRDCEHAAMPRTVRHVWYAVDEYSAMVAEAAVTRLVAAADMHLEGVAADDPLVKARQKLADAALAAYDYRRSRGYPSFVEPGATNEHLPFRQRLLKRLVTSVLYLDTHAGAPGSFLQDLVGMVAAAAAMLFAVLVGIWAQRRWDIFSGAFVAAAVVSYTVKDRIKEWGKRYVGSTVRRFAGLPTRVVRVCESGGQKVIGELRETFCIVDPEGLDDEITTLRHIDHPTDVAEAGRPEVVVSYVKEVTLSSKGLRAQLPAVQGLNDIIRFNVNELRHRMDDPYEEYPHVHPETRELTSARCMRVYHLNLVLRITSGTGKGKRVETERVRVVVNQERILRVEQVTPAVPGAATDPLTGRPSPSGSVARTVVLDDDDDNDDLDDEEPAARAEFGATPA